MLWGCPLALRRIAPEIPWTLFRILDCAFCPAE